VKKVFLNIIFFSVFLTLNISAQFSDWNSEKEVLHESDIKAAGIVNIAEIVTLSQNIFFSSTDGFMYKLGMQDYAGFQRQSFLVYIDGQRFDINMFDMINLNHLPVSIEQIDSVEIYSQPMSYDGAFTETGVIHFHTKKITKGLSFQFVHALVNETGDPGPYQFTEYSSPNVDKFNYVVNANIGAAGKDWMFSTNVKTEDNFLTDPNIKSRVIFMSGSSDAKIKYLSGMFNFFFKVKGNEQHIIAGVTDDKNFFFLEQYGNEIPTYQRFKHFGFNGSVKLDGNLALNYQLKFSESGFDKIENAYEFAFDFRTQNYFGNFALDYSLEKLRLRTAFVYDETVGISSNEFPDNRFRFLKIFGQAEYRPSENFSQTVSAGAVKYQSDHNLYLYLKNKLNVGGRSFIGTSFFFDKKSFDESMSLWRWMSKGYSSNVTEALDYEKIPEFAASKNFAADAFIESEAGKKIFFSLTGFYREALNVLLEERNYQMTSGGYQFHTRVDFVPDADIKFGGGSFYMRFKPAPNLSFSVQYTYQTDLWGTEAYRDYRQAFPNHLASLTMNYKIAASFGIWARLKYISSTQWSEYRYVGYQSDGFYSNALRQKLLFEISLQKWFWGKRIWTNLAFRNISNVNEQYHPIGSDIALRFLFQIHIYLNSILK